MAVKKKATRKRDPAQTRQRILDAAFDAFCEAGLDGARVDDIAARADVNKRMLYHYFGSKEDLFVALLEDKTGQTQRVRKRRPGTLAEDLAYFQEDQIEDARWVRLSMFEALAYGSDDIANEAQRRVGWEAVIETLKRGQEDGYIAPELDPAQLQLSMVALVTFPVAFPQFTKMITGRDPDDPAFLRERKRFLRAFGARIEETPEK